MKNRAPEVVRKRIEYFARKSGLPFKSTGLWNEAPAALAQAVPASLASPVVYSTSDNGEATVIGVDEVFVVLKSGTQRVGLDDLTGVTSPCMRQGREKSEFDALELETTDGRCLTLPTERGSGCFTLWPILLMLIRWQANRFDPRGSDSTISGAILAPLRCGSLPPRSCGPGR